MAAVFSQMRAVTEDGRELRTFPVGSPPEGRIFDRLVRSNFLPAPAVMTRRSAVQSVGGHDESLVFEDWDMWLRLADRYEFRYLPGVLVNYRMLASSVSRSPLFASRMLESSAHIMMKWYGRDARTDKIVLGNAWRFGLRALVIDPPRGQRDPAHGRRSSADGMAAGWCRVVGHSWRGEGRWRVPRLAGRGAATGATTARSLLSQTSAPLVA